MKQLFNILVLVLIANVAIAQAPQGIPYQAAARNSSGAILASTAISVRFTIRDSIATGAIKYRETHSVTTTAQGMFSLNVGQGTVVSGTFAGINWATNAKFMQMEMDPAGGSSYIDMGTQQMMSVPYALYAGNFNPSILGNILPPILASITLKNLYLKSRKVVFESNVLSDAGNAVTSRGIIWSTTPNPTIAHTTKTVDSSGFGFYTSTVLLNPSTIYYIRSYASNTGNTGYSSDLVILTPPDSVGGVYAGGKIAYIVQPYDSNFTISTPHGFIAAPSSLSSNYIWGCYNTLIGATDTNLCSGALNTSRIILGCSTSGIAAQVCDAYSNDGFTDWYLPPITVLRKMLENKTTIGGFFNNYYWSSSEVGDFYAQPLNFGTTTISIDKRNNLRVRPVRSF
jgi:hypothetical protein